MKRLIAVFAGLVLAVLVSASPAQAAAPVAGTGGSPGTKIASRTITGRMMTNGIVSTQSVITCDIAIYYPHKSTHVPGTINVVATINCSALVASLDLDVYLYRSSTLVGDGSNHLEAWASIQANAYSGCTSGSYHGEAFGFIVFPAGYVPWSDSGWVYSPSVPISCP